MKKFCRYLLALFFTFVAINAQAKYLVVDEVDITVQAVNEVSKPKGLKYVELTIFAKDVPLTIMDVVVNDGQCLFISNQILTVIFLQPNGGKRLYFVGRDNQDCVIHTVKIMIKDKERNFKF